MERKQMEEIIEEALMQLAEKHPELRFTILAMDGNHACMVSDLDPHDNLDLLEHAAIRLDGSLRSITENN